MGNTCCVESPTFCGLEASNWIDIIGVIVNAGIGLWVVLTIQSRATNRRILKDHFISEVKSIRDEYKDFLSRLYGNSISPKTIIPWFKLMNVKTADLLNLLDHRYKIHKKMLEAYQIDLREIVTNSPEFNAQFNSSRLILSSDTQNKILKFQQNYSYIFNHIITKINDAS